MAHAPARHGVGGGAKIAIFWRISADFDPIPEGTRQRATGRAAPVLPRLRAEFVQRAGNHGQRSRLPVAGDVGQLATVAGLVSLGK